MSTQRTDDDLPYFQVGDGNWHEPVIELVQTLGARSPLHALLVLPAQHPSTSLSVRILGGLFRNQVGQRVEVVEQSLVLPNNSTRRVWLESNGTPAQGAAWPTDRDVLPLARVITLAGIVSDVLDVRSGLQAYGLQQGPFLPLAGGTLADGANVVLGTGTGTKIGTAVGQKIGFWGSVPVVQQAAVADATGTLADATTKLNALLARLRSVGIIAT